MLTPPQLPSVIIIPPDPVTDVHVMLKKSNAKE